MTDENESMQLLAVGSLVSRTRGVQNSPWFVFEVISYTISKQDQSSKARAGENFERQPQGLGRRKEDDSLFSIKKKKPAPIR